MQKTDGIITSTNEQAETTDMLLTYSEAEKQENEINRENAKLVFEPSFITYFPSVKRKHGLTEIETLLFGFIWFYLGNAQKRFYFTNEQLAGIIDCTPTYVSKSLKTLEDKGLIETSRKMRAGGGLIRFIKKCNTQSAKSAISKVDKVQGNKNKINKNSSMYNIDALHVSKAPVLNSPVRRVVTHLEQTLSTKVTNWGKQAAAWKMMEQAGYTEAQVIKTITYMATRDEFFRERGFDLMTVANYIPHLKAKERRHT